MKMPPRARTFSLKAKFRSVIHTDSLESKLFNQKEDEIDEEIRFILNVDKSFRLIVIMMEKCFFLPDTHVPDTI